MGALNERTTSPRDEEKYQIHNSAEFKEEKYQIHNSADHEFKEYQFKLHVAIDLGTSGCGMGFAYKDKVTIYNKWRDRSRKWTKKTKTQLILDDANRVTCFGNPAKFVYYNLEKEEIEKKGFKLFEKFKMALFDDKMGKIQDIIEAKDDTKIDYINIEQYLTASDGQKVLSKTVFIAVFQYLQAKAKEFVPRNVTQEIIHDDEIQWIVTVPAIWSQNAQNNMKQWITEAGLVNKYILNQCVIVYEPDCASLSIVLYNERH
eukprot:54968_1